MQHLALKQLFKNPNLALSLFITFRENILSSALFKMIYDLQQFFPPIILGYILKFIDEPANPVKVGLLFSFLVLLNNAIGSCLLHQYFFRVMMLGLKFKTSIAGMIYNKSLKLSVASKHESISGEIISLMSDDSQQIQEITLYMHLIWSGPLQICLAVGLLWKTLGPSMIVGVFVLIFVIPLNLWVGKSMKDYQNEKADIKDKRLKHTNEVLNGIKLIKLYAWENLFLTNINNERLKELKLLLKIAIMQAFASFIWTTTPFAVAAITFAVFMYSSASNFLTADKAFVSLTLFSLLRFPLYMIMKVITDLIQVRNSIIRLERFFQLSEIDNDVVNYENLGENAIEMRNSTLTWKNRGFSMKDLTVTIKKGSTVAVVGDVGSGKSSFIQAILGEMILISGSIHIDGTKTYVPQQSWILNTTVRENVVMHNKFNEDLYQRVMFACGLLEDIAILPNGDLTEIGERGINLSGGQKQRINLARTLYSNADIYFLDDPLSYIDYNLSKHIFEKVLSTTGLLSQKTCVLVSNDLRLLPKCDNILYLQDGKIAEEGSFQQIISRNGDLAKLLKNYLFEYNASEQISDTNMPNMLTLTSSKIMKKAQIKNEIVPFDNLRNDSIHIRRATTTDGFDLYAHNFRSIHKSSCTSDYIGNSVASNQTIDELKFNDQTSKKKYKFALGLYLKYFGLAIQICIPVLFVLSLAADVGYNLWLSYWSDNDVKEYNTNRRNIRMIVYLILGLLHGLLYFGCEMSLRYGAYKSSKLVHSTLLKRLVRGTMEFYNVTPIGRIHILLSSDIDVIDSNLTQSLASAVLTLVSILCTIIIITTSNPIFLTIIIPIGFMFYILQRIYISTSRQLYRLHSENRHPIISHFSETLNGLQSIRACSMNKYFIAKNYNLQNINNKVYYSTIIINRWLAIILESFATLIIVSTCMLVVLARKRVNPGHAGVAISNALEISQSLNWLVRMISEIETSTVSIKRILEFFEIDSEAPWIIQENRPPKSWPENGVIKIKNYSLKYQDDMNPTLSNINLVINSGEKFAIVGRSGAGKSSLASAIFRLVEPIAGQIFIDDILIDEIGLHDLRGKITIIPQDPVIFSGSIRHNLDPYHEISEDRIRKVLIDVNLDKFVSSLPGKLNYKVSEGGENLSVGQKQLFCLARAILRKSKVIILDEATASVDFETDELIQNTFKREFKDCTVISIAHRINTIIDYNRIAVLSNGKVVECNSPTMLLSDPESEFSKLVRDSNVYINLDRLSNVVSSNQLQ
ncbi:hypothetical protein GJ496_009667 [Pomphorhynchus laevis]|nr:hypothetical protein GJ496_009667 [Pomphorhynchus laevis]